SGKLDDMVNKFRDLLWSDFLICVTRRKKRQNFYRLNPSNGVKKRFAKFPYLRCVNFSGERIGIVKLYP
ncbi:MAG: hypothetical protein Harvfovirus30_16, partial [Harvfovirus sp.]